MKRYFFLLLLFSTAKIFSQVGINTVNPNPPNIDQGFLDVNGRVIVRVTSTYSGSTNVEPLGIDGNNVIVKLPNTPSRLAFYQSTSSNKYESSGDVNSFNTGNPIVVPWNPANDEIFNDLLTFNTSDQSFSFKQDGVYELSGFLNFGLIMPNSFNNSVNDYVGVNLTVQYLEDANTGAGWRDLATCRSIITGGSLAKSGYISQTLIIPPALHQFSSKDKIRMIMLKPVGENIGGFEISKPTGSIFSKGFKVTVL